MVLYGKWDNYKWLYVAICENMVLYVVLNTTGGARVERPLKHNNGAEKGL